MKLIGENIILSDKATDYLINYLQSKKYSQHFILVDENTREHCLPKLEQINAEIIQIQAGEQFKNLSSCTKVWDVLLDKGADRGSVLINLGGGVIGDMGGFAASTYMRGIDFIQVPTTLLSMVDASIGGKVGVDYRGYKNMIGNFNEPAMVFIQPNMLDTLPDRELMSGYAEMLKHGLISNPSYWNELKKLNKRRFKLQIEESLSIKKEVVDDDPTEKGKRKILNFGHTIGHGIESFGFRAGVDILHGEAIVAGMFMETIISAKTGLTKEDIEDICTSLFGLYPKLPLKIEDAPAIWELILMDKKNKSGKVKSVFLSAPGIPVYNIDLSFPEFEEAFRNYLNS